MPAGVGQCEHSQGEFVESARHGAGIGKQQEVKGHGCRPRPLDVGDDSTGTIFCAVRGGIRAAISHKHSPHPQQSPEPMFPGAEGGSKRFQDVPKSTQPGRGQGEVRGPGEMAVARSWVSEQLPSKSDLGPGPQIPQGTEEEGAGRSSGALVVWLSRSVTVHRRVRGLVPSQACMGDDRPRLLFHTSLFLCSHTPSSLSKQINKNISSSKD